MRAREQRPSRSERQLGADQDPIKVPPSGSSGWPLLQLPQPFSASLRGRRVLGIVVAAAAQKRGRGRHQAGDDREDEGGVESVAERLLRSGGERRRAR